MVRKVTERDRGLGKALADARKAAGLTQAQVGELVNRNQAWVSRTENGTRPPTPNDLDLLLRQYQPEGKLWETIEELRTPPPAGAWHGSRLDPRFMEFKQLEVVASEIFVLTSERIPANLQSDQYLLLQYRRADYAISEKDLFAERRRRQQVFTRQDPPPYHVLLAESALYRMPSGRLDLTKEQASYLLDLIDRYPQLRLRVLPFDADLPYLDADMVILGSSDKPPYKVFVPFGTSVISLKGRDASDRVDYWRAAQEAALDLDQSQKLLHRLSELGYQRPPA